LRSVSKEDRKLPVSKAKRVTSAKVAQLVRSASAIDDGSAPDIVLKSLRGATTDAGARRVIISYLAGKEHDPFARGAAYVSPKFKSN
jgi:hypothetical protein